MPHDEFPGRNINHPFRNLKISRNIHLDLFYPRRIAGNQEKQKAENKT
jgi:hypothetical protein